MSDQTSIFGLFRLPVLSQPCLDGRGEQEQQWSRLGILLGRRNRALEWKSVQRTSPRKATRFIPYAALCLLSLSISPNLPRLRADHPATEQSTAQRNNPPLRILFRVNFEDRVFGIQYPTLAFPRPDAKNGLGLMRSAVRGSLIDIRTRSSMTWGKYPSTRHEQT